MNKGIAKASLLAASAVTVLLAGCAPTSKAVRVTEGQASQARTGPVCFLKSPMPANVKHRVLGEVSSSKEFYGSVNEILPLMAEEARKMGADAVVNVNTGQKIGLWAWARPVGTGMAVKLEKPSDLNCKALGGEMR